MVEALSQTVQKDNSIVTEAVVMVFGITTSGKRRVLDCGVAESENKRTYRDLFQILKEQRLHGVRCVISDAHKGLMAAMGREFQGATRRRCNVPFIRDYAKQLSVKKIKASFCELMKSLYTATSKEEVRPGAEQ